MNNLTLSQKDQNPIKRDGVFRKSSMSGLTDCVEIAKHADGTVQVRDSKNKDTVLNFSAGGWRAFIGGVRQGEFDI